MGTKSQNREVKYILVHRAAGAVDKTWCDDVGRTSSRGLLELAIWEFQVEQCGGGGGRKSVVSEPCKQRALG